MLAAAAIRTQLGRVPDGCHVVVGQIRTSKERYRDVRQEIALPAGVELLEVSGVPRSILGFDIPLRNCRRLRRDITHGTGER